MRVFILASLLCWCGPLRPQQDVAALVASPSAWQSREVGDGVFLRQRWFPTLFAGPQSVTVLEVAPAAPARFDLVAPGKRTRTSAMATDGGALAAINGGYFAIASTGLSIGLLRLDGELKVPANEGQGCVGIGRDGRLQLAARPAGDWPEMVEALGAGPMLLAAGKVVDHGERLRQVRHPRSAIGVTADNRVLWLTVDGRTDKALGMTFEETAAVLAALGCRDGLNLDGGGSTTLWVAGCGVCNFPCDNKRYDHDGERAVANALLLHAPAVVVVDDDDAELLGASWRQRTDGEHVFGPDFAACDAPGARAVFRTRLPFSGRWRVAGRKPVTIVQPSAWTLELPGVASATTVSVAAGDWRDLGEFTIGGDNRAAVALAGTRGTLVVDAVRFVQVRD